MKTRTRLNFIFAFFIFLFGSAHGQQARSGIAQEKQRLEADLGLMVKELNKEMEGYSKNKVDSDRYKLEIKNCKIIHTSPPPFHNTINLNKDGVKIIHHIEVIINTVGFYCLGDKKCVYSEINGKPDFSSGLSIPFTGKMMKKSKEFSEKIALYSNQCLSGSGTLQNLDHSKTIKENLKNYQRDKMAAETRSGGFHPMPGSFPVREHNYLAYHAHCDEGGRAWVNVNNGSQGVVCWGGAQGEAGCGVISIEAGLQKACRGNN